MASREDLIPLIGLKVEARRDQNRTITKGMLLDVGTKSIFVRHESNQTIYEIEFPNLSSIKYMKEEDIRGPFDGRREPGDNRGG